MRLKILMGVEIILIIAMAPFLFIAETLIGDAVHFSIAVICIAILVLSYMIQKKIVVHFNKDEIAIGILLTGLFILMMSIFDIINSGFFNIQKLLNTYPDVGAWLIWIWGHIIYLPGIFIASLILIMGALYYVQKDKIGRYSNITYRGCILIIIVVSLIYLFSAYPGIWISDDVKSVWNDVVNGNLRAWHTLGYEVFVLLCSFIKKSSFTVCIVQTILWILLNAYILKVLREESTRNMMIYTTVLVCVVAPFNYLEVMYKDVVFSMGILAITVAIYHVIKKKSIVWQDMTSFLVGGAFASTCRYAGNVVVVIALMITLLYFVVKRQKKPQKYMIGVIIFQLFFYLFVNVGLMSLLNVTKNPAYIKYTMPMVTIGAAASNNIEFDAEDMEVLEMVMPVEEWGNCYDKYWGDTISRTWGKIGDRINTVNVLIENERYGIKVLEINAKLLIHHPYIYIKSIFDMNNIIWKIATPNDGYEWALCNVTPNEQIVYCAPFIYTNSWTQFMCRNPVINTIFTRRGYFCML